MADITNLRDFLRETTNAIREKKGTVDKINAQNIPNEIRSIISGENLDTLESPNFAFVNGELYGDLRSGEQNFYKLVSVKSDEYNNVQCESFPVQFAINYKNNVCYYDQTDFPNQVEGFPYDEYIIVKRTKGDYAESSVVAGCLSDKTLITRDSYGNAEVTSNINDICYEIGVDNLIGYLNGLGYTVN